MSSEEARKRAESIIETTLASTRFSCQTLEVISGGFTNFTFRGMLNEAEEGNGPRSIFIKLPKTITEADSTSDASRSHYEHRIMSAASTATIPSLSPLHLQIFIPHPLSYFPSSHLLLTQDFPSATNLKAYLLTHPISPSFSRLLGASLGHWLSSFHTWTLQPAQVALRAEMSCNTDAPDSKFNSSYGQLRQTVDVFPDVLTPYTELFEAVETRVRGAITQKGGLPIIHGDLWAGNMLIDVPHEEDATKSEATSEGSPAEPPSSPVKLILVDWELSHTAPVSIELGDLLAEFYILHHFDESAEIPVLIDAFTESYGVLDIEDAFLTMIHCGVHLVAWTWQIPRFRHDERLESCLKVACGFIENAFAGRGEWFRGGIFGRLFGSPTKGLESEMDQS